MYNNNIRVYRRRYDTRKICVEHDVHEVGRDFSTVESRRKFGTTEAEKSLSTQFHGLYSGTSVLYTLFYYYYS